MIDQLKGVNLYLIGMMGAGKTTVGQILATHLGYKFFDTDVVIEQLANQTVSQFFAEAGESQFRKLETQVLAELCAYSRLVVATGGGCVLQRENWSYLRHGIIVWLDVPLEQLLQRLQTDTTRPLLQDLDRAAQLQVLLTERSPLYAQADMRVSYQAHETTDQLAVRILEEMQPLLKKHL